MDNKETIKVLKRMKSPDMEADEFAAIQKAIKSVEENDKHEDRQRLIRKKFDELNLNCMAKEELNAEIEELTVAEIKENFYEMYCLLKDIQFLVCG